MDDAESPWQPMATAPAGRMVLTSTRHQAESVHGPHIWYRPAIAVFDGHQWFDEHGSPMHTPAAWMHLPYPPREALQPEPPRAEPAG